MWRKLHRFVIPFVLLFVLLPVIASCASTNTTNTNTANVPMIPANPNPSTTVQKPLPEVEIDEYQGEKLSSINDFRENSILGPQYVNAEQYRLKISGLVSNPQEYTYNDAITSYNSYNKIVTLDCVEGWSVRILWEGILVKDLLATAKPLSTAKVVIFHAHDGYTTSFPIEYLMDNEIMMAYKMNGTVLPPERGFPFQLVAESKWGYKWIKWITEIELSDDVNYKGYWEKRGYSNTGDLDKSFFD